MPGPADDDFSRDATGDQCAGLPNQRLVRTDLGGRAAQLEVRRVDHPLGAVLTLAGELDLATIPVLEEELDRAARATQTVVIDLSGLLFIDSSGLRTLVGAERQVRASGGRLVLVRGSRALRRVFELSGLHRYFEWCDSARAALRTSNAADPRARLHRHAADKLDSELGGVMSS